MKSGEGSPDSNDKDDEVMTFGDLHQSDSISVKTERSNYRFSILDPISRLGMLTGGALGDEVREAVLIGAVSEDKTLYDTTELKTGWRALFFFEANNCVNHMVTSVVTDIAHIKETIDESRAA